MTPASPVASLLSLCRLLGTASDPHLLMKRCSGFLMGHLLPCWTLLLGGVGIRLRPCFAGERASTETGRGVLDLEGGVRDGHVPAGREDASAGRSWGPFVP